MVGDHSPLIKIDQEDPPGLKASLTQYVFSRFSNYANLRGHDAPVVLRDIKPGWPEPISIKNSPDAAPI